MNIKCPPGNVLSYLHILPSFTLTVAQWGRKLLFALYGYCGWDKVWDVFSKAAWVRRATMTWAYSGLGACVYIECACVGCRWVLVWVCGPMWRVDMCGDQRLTPDIFLILAIPPCSGDSLSLSLELLSSASCLANDSNRLVSTAPDLGFPSVYVGAGKSSCLHRSHFTN